MKTAAAYIRVSTEDQIEYSPESQLKAIREYAKRSGMLLLEDFVFVDEGISGRKAEKRPEFMRMIAAAKKKPKPFDAILLWKFSRFARNREDSIVYKSMLRKQMGIEVISITEQLGEDKTSILIEALLEAMDEYYSVNLAEEVKRGMAEKASRGEVVSAPPFGYDVESNVYVPNGDAKTVQIIFSDYAGGMGCREIAAKLNAMAIRTKRGNRWETRTVEYLLSNPVYIGKLHWSPSGRSLSPDAIVKNGKHEPIITKEIFSIVNKKLRERKKKAPAYTREPQNTDYLFKGLVRCSSCGSALIRSLKGKALQCHAYAKGRCLTSHSINSSILYDIVISTARKDIRKDSFEIQLLNQAPENGSETIKKLIARERFKLQKAAEAYQNGVDSLEEYRINKQTIQNKIREYQDRLFSSPGIPSGFEKKMESAIKSLEESGLCAGEQNKLLHSFISKIIFDRTLGTIQIFYA